MALSYRKPIQSAVKPHLWCYLNILIGWDHTMSEMVEAIIEENWNKLTEQERDFMIASIKEQYPEEYACIFKDGKLQSKGEYLRTRRLRIIAKIKRA